MIRRLERYDMCLMTICWYEGSLLSCSDKKPSRRTCDMSHVLWTTLGADILIEKIYGDKRCNNIAKTIQYDLYDINYVINYIGYNISPCILYILRRLLARILGQKSSYQRKMNLSLTLKYWLCFFFQCARIMTKLGRKSRKNHEHWRIFAFI